MYEVLFSDAYSRKSKWQVRQGSGGLCIYAVGADGLA